MNEIWRNEAQKAARRKQKARYLARVAAGAVVQRRPQTRKTAPRKRAKTRWQLYVARRQRRRADGKRIWGEMQAEWARLKKSRARAAAKRNRENRARLIAGREERLRVEKERREGPIRTLKALAEAGNPTIDAFLSKVGVFSFLEMTSPRGTYYDPSWNAWVDGRESEGAFLPARYGPNHRPAAYVVAPWVEKDFRTMDRVLRSLGAAEEDPRIKAELKKTLKAIRPKAKQVRREAMLRLGYHVPALQ